ncbi:UNVERIFIED_CONTAM: hypothetical protein FKN15_055947 [Acipenser sinensis]
MTELPRRSLFESPSAQPHQSRMLPAFPDFIKEVQSTWGAPASDPATSRKASAFNMQGASEAGLASFPPVDAAFAAFVKTPTLSGLTKDPACPNKQCRTTEVALVRDLPECPSAALRSELVTVSQLLVRLAQLNSRAQGRSIASLVVARRQLWLSQARVQELDKAPLLDAPILPGHTFGPAVEEMLQRSAKAAPRRRSKWRKCGQISRSSLSSLRNISGVGHHHSSRRNHGAVRPPLQVHQCAADLRL